MRFAYFSSIPLSLPLDHLTVSVHSQGLWEAGMAGLLHPRGLREVSTPATLRRERTE